MDGALRNLGPLFASVGILLAGNGLQGTLIAVRANIEGYSPTLIGLMGTAYFLGFIAGCLSAGGWVRRVGHIRVFAAFAATAGATTLAMVIVVDPWAWMTVRLVQGVCFAVLITVVESWLNESSRNADRARVLATYSLVDLVSVLGAQFVLPLAGPEGFLAFALIAMAYSLAVVPVSLARVASPNLPPAGRVRLSRAWAVSPMAVFGCVTIGMTTGAFRAIGPVYAQQIGFDVGQVALFIGAGILGGAIAQFPLGALSDRFDRRRVLVVATLGAVLAGLFLSGLDTQEGAWLVYSGAFAFGAFAMPLYSLSVAHANDFDVDGDYVGLSAALILSYSLGAAAGPFIVSVAIDLFGPGAFFIYTSVCHGALVLFGLYRMTQRDTVAPGRTTRFVALLRTSPTFSRLVRRQAMRRGAPGPRAGGYGERR